MEKKGVLGLDALISILVAVFVLVSILYAESKFMSVQNMDMKKEAKRLSLMAEAMQIMPSGFSAEYKELNYSLSISDGKVYVEPSDSGWKSESSYVAYSGMKSSCNLKVVTERRGENNVDKLPFAVFTKNGKDMLCSDMNIVGVDGDDS